MADIFKHLPHGEGTVWGVRHCRGIKWVGPKEAAIELMREKVAHDVDLAPHNRGKVRLVYRYVCPPAVEVNPYPEQARPLHPEPRFERDRW